MTARGAAGSELTELRERVDKLEETLGRIRDVLVGDRAVVSGDATVIRDCIVDAIEGGR